MNSKNILSALADLLTWILALVSVSVAWWQSARLFAAFGDPSAPWWPYLAATAIEGGIIVAGLVLMTDRTAYAPAVALLVFVANSLLSVLAQVGEAALSAGYDLPQWLQLVVRFAAPASVTIIGAALWTLKILRSWHGETAATKTEAPPAQLPLPFVREFTAEKANGHAPKVGRPKVRG